MPTERNVTLRVLMGLSSDPSAVCRRGGRLGPAPAGGASNSVSDMTIRNLEFTLTHRERESIYSRDEVIDRQLTTSWHANYGNSGVP
jgi:hypothetical protein